MIGHTSSGASFSALASYLQEGRHEEEDRVAWVETRGTFEQENLAELAAEMQDTAGALGKRVEQPCYHVSVSWDGGTEGSPGQPGRPPEEPTREEMVAVAEQLLEDLGLSEHQAAIIAHSDTRHRHVHVMVNRVHPETGQTWDRWMDRPKVERSLREQERARGFREVPGTLSRLAGQQRPDRSESLGRGAFQQARRTGERPFSELAREVAAEDFREAESWADLSERLARHGLRVEAKGRGGVVTDGHEQAKLSGIGRRFSRGRLEMRFGETYATYREREERRARRRAQEPQAEQRQAEQQQAAERPQRAPEGRRAGRGRTDRGAGAGARERGAGRGAAEPGRAGRGRAGGEAGGAVGAELGDPDAWLPVDHRGDRDAADGRAGAWLAVDRGAGGAADRGAGPAGVADPDAAGARARQGALGAGLSADEAGHVAAAAGDAVAWAELRRLGAAAAAAEEAWGEALWDAQGCQEREEAYQEARRGVRAALQEAMRAPEKAAGRFNQLAGRVGPEKAFRALGEAPERFGRLRRLRREAREELAGRAEALRAALRARPSLEEGKAAYREKNRYWARRQALREGLRDLLRGRGIDAAAGLEAGGQQLEQRVRERAGAMSEGAREALERVSDGPARDLVQQIQGSIRQAAERAAELKAWRKSRERSQERGQNRGMSL